MSLPDDVRLVLDDLVDGARAALGDRLVGAYVVGSFALGCADEWSDVDFVLVTDGRADGEALDRLRTLHARLPTAAGGQRTSRARTPTSPTCAAR